MAFTAENRISRTDEHYTKYLYQFNENDPIVGIIFGHFAPFTGPNGHGRLVQKLLSIGAKEILIATPNNTKPFDDDREMFSAEQRKDIIQAYLDSEGIDGEAIVYERRRGPVASQMGPLCALAAQKFGLDIRPVFCFGPDRAEIVQDVCNPFGKIADPTHCEFVVDYDRGTSGTKVRELIRDNNIEGIMKETGYSEDVAQKLIDLRNKNTKMNERHSLSSLFSQLLNEKNIDFAKYSTDIDKDDYSLWDKSFKAISNAFIDTLKKGLSSDADVTEPVDGLDAELRSGRSKTSKHALEVCSVKPAESAETTAEDIKKILKGRTFTTESFKLSGKKNPIMLQAEVHVIDVDAEDISKRTRQTASGTYPAISIEYEAKMMLNDEEFATKQYEGYITISSQTAKRTGENKVLANYLDDKFLPSTLPQLQEFINDCELAGFTYESTDNFIKIGECVSLEYHQTGDPGSVELVNLYRVKNKASDNITYTKLSNDNNFTEFRNCLETIIDCIDASENKKQNYKVKLNAVFENKALFNLSSSQLESASMIYKLKRAPVDSYAEFYSPEAFPLIDFLLVSNGIKQPYSVKDEDGGNKSPIITFMKAVEKPTLDSLNDTANFAKAKEAFEKVLDSLDKYFVRISNQKFNKKLFTKPAKLGDVSDKATPNDKYGSSINDSDLAVYLAYNLIVSCNEDSYTNKEVVEHSFGKLLTELDSIHQDYVNRYFYGRLYSDNKPVDDKEDHLIVNELEKIIVASINSNPTILETIKTAICDFAKEAFGNDVYVTKIKPAKDAFEEIDQKDDSGLVLKAIARGGGESELVFKTDDGIKLGITKGTGKGSYIGYEFKLKESSIAKQLNRINDSLKLLKLRLQEGGNLSAQGKYGVKSATKLQMDKFTPEVFADFKDDFMKFLLKLNDMYAKKTGHKVWENEKFLQSGNCFSGSTRTMFQKSFVDYSTFKKKVGDFDIQIPESEQGTWLDFINSLQDKPVDGFTIYGNTSNFAQDHSLVQATDPEYAGVGADFLQVDWEYVPFKDGKPTEFATFAHYSSWEDLQNNVKGLFVKLLLRAIGHCVHDDDTVLVSQKTGRISKTKGQPRYNPNDLAFSVDKGVRHKLAAYIDPETGKPAIDPETGRRKVYNKDVKDGVYDTDMDKIFEDFFGRPPKDATELKQLYSFIRCLKLMKANYTQDHIEEIFEYFLELIISPYAQKLSAFDKEEDKEWKESAIAKFYETFPYLKDKFDKKVEKMKEAYYAAYVNRARDSEVGNGDDNAAMHESIMLRRRRFIEAMEGKHSLPHLYNYGKPSEIKDKDFYKFIEWLDENDGILDDSNSSINEKLDGSSQFFGIDNDGFFWEKFGSDDRYYSADEIPPYFGMYKQLFEDLEEALQPELKSIKDVNKASEVKTQIEVILPNKGIYKVNLVTYKPDAFKKGGCLSIIQTLADGTELSNAANNEIAQSLSNLDYTVIAGYKLNNYKIDLSKELSDLLQSIDTDEDNATIEELLELPTRKWHQTKAYESFENCKMQMSDKILKSLSDKAGNLSEDGLYEGLVITLDNGFAFKVNSPMFKEAFASHRRH